MKKNRYDRNKGRALVGEISPAIAGKRVSKVYGFPKGAIPTAVDFSSASTEQACHLTLSAMKDMVVHGAVNFFKP
ncbi:MAG: hypothetical protein JEY79_12600 [Pseudodesulfovibrio sp.]|nr:hypothetical protein [Pseudodesulfovibrio sp.]